MKKVITFLLLILLIAGAITLVKKKRAELQALPTATLPPLVIKIAQPQEREVNQTKRFLATYHSLQKALLATKFAGKIERVFVKEGQKVTKGETLALLDNSEIAAAIENAQARLSAAKAALASTKALLAADEASMEVAADAYKRAQKLFRAEAISKESLQKAKAAYLAAKAKLLSTKLSIRAKEKELQAALANLEAKKAALAYTQIKAPFDGVVEHLFFKEGSFAPLGKPILSLIGGESVFDILFEKGLDVGMHLAGYPCTIDTILPYAQNSLKIARSYCPANLPQESSQTLTVIQKSQKAKALPLAALYEQHGEYFVFIYKNGSFTPQKVSVATVGEKFFIPSPAINDPVALGTHSELGKLFFTQNVKVVRE